jgi:oligopeptide/dipeptide ABC transporter ATP-binding protein
MNFVHGDEVLFRNGPETERRGGMLRMNANILLSVRGLRKLFPIKGGFFSKQRGVIFAVNGVSLDLPGNTNLGLVGESGSGKTTVGKCLIRLIEPTGGDIKFEDTDICKLDPRGLRAIRKKMQMIFQDPYASLDPRTTVEEIVGEGLTIHNLARGSEKRQRVAELLRKVGIMPENMKRYPHEFSGGQRQRIGIARALALNPSLVIADEPVSALDVSIKAQVINLMMQLQEEYSLSYIIISHDLAVVQHMCDKIAVMYLGKIVESADADVFYESPLHPYSRSLLSAVPIPDPEVKVNRIILNGDIPSFAKPPSGCLFHTRCPLRKEEGCRMQEPELRDVGQGHYVACHLSES